jgi:hypothetical protein
MARQDHYTSFRSSITGGNTDNTYAFIKSKCMAATMFIASQKAANASCSQQKQLLLVGESTNPFTKQNVFSFFDDFLFLFIQLQVSFSLLQVSF